MTDAGSLFSVPVPSARTVPQRPTTTRPVWSKYTPRNPRRCDDCMQYLAEHNGRGPDAQYARMRRVGAGNDRLLCYPHAQIWRDRENGPTT